MNSQLVPVQVHFNFGSDKNNAWASVQGNTVYCFVYFAVMLTSSIFSIQAVIGHQMQQQQVK